MEALLKCKHPRLHLSHLNNFRLTVLRPPSVCVCVLFIASRSGPVSLRVGAAEGSVRASEPGEGKLTDGLCFH